MIDKSQGMPLLAATNQSLNPGDFPIGSAESRAAARAILVARQLEERHCGACFLAGFGASDGGDPNNRKFLNNPHMEWRDGPWHYKRLTPEEHLRLLGFVGCGLKMAVSSSFWQRERG